MSNKVKREVLKAHTDSHMKRRVQKIAKRKQVSESKILLRAVIDYVEREEEAAV